MPETERVAIKSPEGKFVGLMERVAAEKSGIPFSAETDDVEAVRGRIIDRLKKAEERRALEEAEDAPRLNRGGQILDAYLKGTELSEQNQATLKRITVLVNTGNFAKLTEDELKFLIEARWIEPEKTGTEKAKIERLKKEVTQERNARLSHVIEKAKEQGGFAEADKFSSHHIYDLYLLSLRCFDDIENPTTFYSNVFDSLTVTEQEAMYRTKMVKGTDLTSEQLQRIQSQGWGARPVSVSPVAGS